MLMIMTIEQFTDDDDAADDDDDDDSDGLDIDDDKEADDDDDDDDVNDESLPSIGAGNRVGSAYTADTIAKTQPTNHQSDIIDNAVATALAGWNTTLCTLSF